jgi:hypothetical protein
VVRSDGNLGGYGFGIERKASLIRREEENLKKAMPDKANEG